MVGIGFFAPFPLALMVPFMAGQSLAMGEAFGKGFQYGKRKISSMSNEEFNKLDFRELSESLATDYRVMIPSLVESIKASDRLQDAVFKALADVIKDIPSQILDFFGDVSSQSRSALSPTNTLTQTSFSTSTPLTEVRAGSGLGDIRKQQEALKQQNAELEANKTRENINKIKAHQAEREKTEAFAKSIEQQKGVTKEIARAVSVVTPTVTKRKAGQSQLLERNKLVREIASINKDYQFQRNLAITRQSQPNADNANSLFQQMKAKQKLLAVLLTRYKF